MFTPSATYRVQLHRDFTLSDLSRIIDYLHMLGISTVYAAPVLQAIPGSLHGYDVIDPHIVNPEIGTLDDLRSVAMKLRERGMTWIQDIVPNHMAFSTLNYWLMDVMERREHSPFYHYFDIDWQHPSANLHGRLQVPFLAETREECVARGEIAVSFSHKGFSVQYRDTAYPLSLSAFEFLFDGADAGFCWRDFVSMGESATDYMDWKNDKENYMASIVNDERSVRPLRLFLEDFNRDRGKLVKLLDRQYYHLTHWKDTDREINYRRFFTVNELICLRMEEESVFDDYHRFIHRLYDEGLIQGLRIDHIDGLQDPLTYARRLRTLFGDSCYIIAEKILGADEDLPQQWPLQGTSGYEFLSFVSQLVTNRKGAREMVSFYRQLVPDVPSYRRLVRDNKEMILSRYMQGEWNNLVRYAETLGLAGGYSTEEIRHAVAALMISMPVYRVYPSRIPLKGEAREVMEQAFNGAALLAPGLQGVLNYFRDLVFAPDRDEEARVKVLSFVRRLMQFTGPLTAKGVEDTTFYIYNALISHDEVGDAPSTLGISVQNFHVKMAERQHSNPLSLNATATHDTKRGEDARLRLNVLCEFPDEWSQHIVRWLADNSAFRQAPGGKTAPTLNDEYYMYQAIVGGFPDDLRVTTDWIDRLVAYEIKVLREAKVNSDWANPDEAYEGACESFLRSILATGSVFLRSFIPFMEKVVEEAHQYALAQVLIKATAPGIPDTYQGCELWDLSFVDPDNRRPVDFDARKALLDEIMAREKDGPEALFVYLRRNWRTGAEKLFVTWKALTFRSEHRDVFLRGSYVALQQPVAGPVTVVFARHFQGEWILVVAPLQNAGVQNRVDPENDIIVLPENSPGEWLNVFSGERLTSSGVLRMSEVVRSFPLALLYGSVT